MTELPCTPWSRVSADFCGPFPTGEYLLVVIDDHSRYPVVEIIRSASARTVIPVFDKIFSLFGIPEELKTDNGPPFQSLEFKTLQVTWASNIGELPHCGQKQMVKLSASCAQLENTSEQQTLSQETGSRKCTPS